MPKGLLKYFDIIYFAKFLSLFLFLYFFNLFYIGVTAPEGRIYLSFLDDHLNYISWLSDSLLYTANLIPHLFGIRSYVVEPDTLEVSGGASVALRYSCLGLGIMSFWVAFITTFNSGLKKKLLWCFFGLAAIWIINCLRIGLLLVALQKQWQVDKNIDHHTLFNYIAYALVLLMIYFFTKESGLQKKVALT